MMSSVHRKVTQTNHQFLKNRPDIGTKRGCLWKHRLMVTLITLASLVVLNTNLRYLVVHYITDHLKQIGRGPNCVQCCTSADLSRLIKMVIIAII